MKELENRAIKAASMFVARRGYEVLDEEWGIPEQEIKIDLVARDKNDIVFIDVKARAHGDSLPDEDIDRKRLESVAARWLASHPEQAEDVTVRFDAISMMVVREDRALSRYFCQYRLYRIYIYVGKVPDTACRT